MSSQPAIFDIRPVSVEDAHAVAELSGELGYPTEQVVMERRIEALGQTAQHAIFVACLAHSTVAAWIDISIESHLASGPRALIAGLVVGRDFRGVGIGRALVAKAEGWARDQGIDTLLVRSNVVREAAHKFYLNDGFLRKKTSAVFEKSL